MGILDDDVARVRESTDLVALAGEHIALKRVGRRFMGLCPFHNEKTPSFSINPELGVYMFFGCQKSGDAITFIREVEHLDFVEAVERLAARAGITLRYDDVAVGKDRKRRERLSEVVAAAIVFYHRLLVEAPEGGSGRKHLRSRNFDGDAARRFQLGWAPDGFDALSVHLQREGFERKDIQDAGLAFVNRANKLQDQFRSRLMFPIYDARGEPAGFGGRALGDDHFQILKNLARKVVLAYDADSAGQAAAERWYQWEQAYEVQVQVADLPPGRDPGDLWKDDPAALTAAIERAAPFLQFRIDRLLAGADLRTLESKARTAEDAAAIVAAHPNELVRDQYVMKLAGMLDIDADQLRAAVRAGPRRRPARDARRAGEVDTAAPPPAQVDRRELDVLRWAIHRPDLVADWLDASLFIDPAARSLFEFLVESPTFQEALDASDDSTRALLQRLANEEPPGIDDPDELATMRARLMTNTVEPAAQRLLTAMLRDGDERGSEVKAHLSAMAHHREIGDWEAARNDAEQLVGWAVARSDGSDGPRE